MAPAGKIPGSRTLKAKKKPEAEWERIKRPFERIFIAERKTLPETMVIMKNEYNFDATPDQYARRMKKWGIGKYEKGSTSRTSEEPGIADTPTRSSVGSIQTDYTRSLHGHTAFDQRESSLSSPFARTEESLQPSSKKTSVPAHSAPTTSHVLGRTSWHTTQENTRMADERLAPTLMQPQVPPDADIPYLQLSQHDQTYHNPIIRQNNNGGGDDDEDGVIGHSTGSDEEEAYNEQNAHEEQDPASSDEASGHFW